MTTPRGIRNNNPTNLEDFGIDWQGLDAPRRDAGNYLRFRTPFWGLRAGARDLHTKWAKDGLRSLAAILPKFAPSKDGNDVPAYVAAVAAEMGIAAGEALDLADAEVLADLVKAVIQHENGMQPYTDELIGQAVASALA